MPTVKTPRSSWIEAGLAALAEGGPGAVRVEPLARTLGVTKGSFYWHFPDRSALLPELLDAWERRSVDEVISQVEAKGGSARTKLRRVFALATDDLQRIDLAVREWARHDASVSTRLRTVDNRRMDFMRSQFRTFCTDKDDVEARCVLALALFIGNHFMAADHGDRTRTDVVAAAAKKLLA